MSKKRSSEEITEKIVLDELENDDSDSEFDPDKTVKLDLNEEDPEPAVPTEKKKPSKRSSSVEPLKMGTVLDDSEEEPKEEKKKESKPERRRKERRAKAKPIENFVKDDPEDTLHSISIASATMHKSMESMVKQWNSVKDISTSLSGNLEKISGLVEQFPSSYEMAVTEMLKRNPPKSSTAHRMAVGFSAVALLLSFISLVFSQTARQSALNPNDVALTETPALSEKVVEHLPLYPKLSQSGQEQSSDKVSNDEAIAKKPRSSKKVTGRRSR